MATQVHNFAGGPATLPNEVVQELCESLVDYRGSGIGILEHSHRGRLVDELFTETLDLVRDIAEVPESFDILLIPGGATLQFSMAPMNLLRADDVAAYLLNGPWSKKAYEEAKLVANVKAIEVDGTAAGIAEADGSLGSYTYAHYTSNETIFGTRFVHLPKHAKSLVCDGCSDLFSRPIDFTGHSVLYASAQKNIGAAGVCLVLAQRDVIDRAPRHLPKMLQYRSHRDATSRFNTPPVFAVFAMNRMLRWIRVNGGLAGMAAKNATKSDLLYKFLERSHVFQGLAPRDCRSRLNITFGSKDPKMDCQFLRFAEERGLHNLSGHRSLGGLRASVYNGVSIQSVQRLVDVLAEFDHQFG